MVPKPFPTMAEFGESELLAPANKIPPLSVVEPEYVHAPCEGRAVQRIDGALECDADD